MAKVKPVPERYHTVTPYLSLKDAHKAIDFYRKAFGAEERFRMPMPDGKVAHAEIMIGDSILMVSEAMQEPVTSASLYLYVPDADAVFARAVSAGAHADMPLADMFWGDRYGRVTDPFGVRWQIATHKEDVSPEEMTKRASQAFQST
jgi:PhnB protein